MKKRIFCDPALLLAVIVLAVVSSIAGVGTILGMAHEGSVATPSEMVSIRIMFGVLLLGLWLALIASSPRFLCVLTLSKSTITVWIPFKKMEDLPPIAIEKKFKSSPFILTEKSFFQILFLVLFLLTS